MTENEINLWSEQKEGIRQFLQDHNEGKNREIGLLKNHVDIMQRELENSRKLSEANITNVINSVELQLNLFKERELFTVSQLLELEDKFTNFREEKERTISILKEEISDLKGHNILLSKIKIDQIK